MFGSLSNPIVSLALVFTSDHWDKIPIVVYCGIDKVELTTEKRAKYWYHRRIKVCSPVTEVNWPVNLFSIINLKPVKSLESFYKILFIWNNSFNDWIMTGKGFTDYFIVRFYLSISFWKILHSWYKLTCQNITCKSIR